MRQIRLIAAGLLLVLSNTVAVAEKRVAFVVGNSTYQATPRLTNPARDAESVANMLKKSGYQVTLVKDVGYLDFKRAIRAFEDSAGDADVAVIFYAGHGIEFAGTNYLIPVDAKLASDRDAPDEAIDLSRLISTVDGVKQLRLIILDACRDNPFLSIMKRRQAQRQIMSGLGPVNVASETFVAFAAARGATADDGDGDHSPFTTAILHNLPEPGLDIRIAFGRVRDEVRQMTKNRQEPYFYGSLGGGDIAVVPLPEKSALQAGSLLPLVPNEVRCQHRKRTPGKQHRRCPMYLLPPNDVPSALKANPESKSLNLLAGVEGLEPPTPGFGD
jgi:Caspase domain